MEEGDNFKIVQKETWGNKESVTVHELDGDNWKVVRFIIEKILVCLLLSRRNNISFYFHFGGPVGI